MSNKVTMSVTDTNLPPYINIINNGNTRVIGRIPWDSSLAPTWNTEEGTILYLDESDENQNFQFNASPSINGTTLTYSIIPSLDGIGGFLPFGFLLDSSTGTMTGDLQVNLINDAGSERLEFFDEERPIWNTKSGNLAKVNEKSIVDLTLNAEYQDGGELVYFHIVKGELPFGLELKFNTGHIVGTVNEILRPVKEQIKRSPTSPRWATPSGVVGIFDERTNIETTIAATSHTGNVTYCVEKGFLPHGVYLDSNSGVISGNTGDIINKSNIIDQINFPRLVPIPTWVTSRATPIASVREKTSIDVELSLNYPEVYGDLYFRIIRGSLPFGIEMSKSGRITGTTSEILQIRPESESAIPVVPNKPVWVTNNGSTIGDFGERENVSIDLLANSLNDADMKYIIQKGNLPFGLTIVGNKIVGNTGEVITKISATDTIGFTITDNKPMWNMLSGNLATVGENENIDIPLLALSPINSELHYLVIDGALPYGVELSKEGILSGIVNELLTPEVEQIFDEGELIINGDSSIGEFEVGDNVDVELFTLQLEDNRTMKAVEVKMTSTNVLPFGLYVSNDGKLSGTIADGTPLGLYSFEVVVVDNLGVSAKRIFELQVA